MLRKHILNRGVHRLCSCIRVPLGGALYDSKVPLTLFVERAEVAEVARQDGLLAVARTCEDVVVVESGLPRRQSRIQFVDDMSEPAQDRAHRRRDIMVSNHADPHD